MTTREPNNQIKTLAWSLNLNLAAPYSKVLKDSLTTIGSEGQDQATVKDKIWV